MKSSSMEEEDDFDVYDDENEKEKARLKKQIARLQAECDELTVRLNEETNDKEKAAKYGLSLFDENRALSSRVGELEALVDSYKADLETTHSALSKMKERKKLEEARDLSLEQNLIYESEETADREEKLLQQLNKLEIDLNKSRQDVKRMQSDNEKLALAHQELAGQHEELKEELIKVKSELKQAKERENRLIDENSELVSENVQLQQHIARLRENLVEFDTTKHENKMLIEKLDHKESQLAEVSALKRIIEKQLEEALNSMKEEREHKYQRKRESNERREKQSRMQLKSLENTITSNNLLNNMYGLDIEDDDDDDDEDGDGDGSMRHHHHHHRHHHNQIEEDEDDTTAGEDGKKKEQSLFSEINANELEKLEKNIDELKKLNEQNEIELNEFRTDTNLLLSHLDSLSNHVLRPLFAKANKPLTSSVDESSNKSKLLTHFERFKHDLESLLGDSDHLTRADDNNSDAIYLKESWLSFRKSIEQLNQTLNKSMTTKQDESAVLDGIKETEQQQQQQQQQLDINIDNKMLVDGTIDAFNQLKLNYEKIVKLKSALLSSDDPLNGAALPNDVQELQDQIVKLKSLLSTKREQIATLRTVLKANKQTAEVALANLKSKYENEKLVVTETMQKLRNELKTLKEDAATFATLRAMFTARCDEYVAQLDETQRMLMAAEEEKKTLNSLLRLAIQQKLKLTQRLEDLEMDNERHSSSTTTSTTSTTATSTAPSNSTSGFSLASITSGAVNALSNTVSISNGNQSNQSNQSG